MAPRACDVKVFVEASATCCKMHPNAFESSVDQHYIRDGHAANVNLGSRGVFSKPVKVWVLIHAWGTCFETLELRDSG